MDADRATVIIALTASSFEEERAVILAAGCDDFLRKPFRETDLLQKIHAHLGIQFVYDDERAQTALLTGKTPLSPKNLQAELVSLPSPLLADLERSAASADVALVDTSVDRVRTHNVALADALAALADEFAYDRLLALVQEAKKRR